MKKSVFHGPFSWLYALPQQCGNGSAGADAGGAGLEEIFHFLFAVDAAGGFDFNLWSHVFLKELDIGKGGAGAAEAGGGFDKVPSPFGDGAAGGDFLFFRKIAGFHDDLQDMAAGSFLHLPDFIGHIGEISLLQGANMDDHVDFIGAVCYGRVGLRDFGRGAAVSQRKSHHRADGKGREMLPDFFHKGRGNAYRCHMVLLRFLAEFSDVLPGGRRLQKGVVHMGKDEIIGHGNAPFRKICFFLHYSRKRQGIPAFPVSQGHITLPCKFIEEKQGNDGGHCKDGGIGGSIAVIAADNFRVNGYGEGLGGVGVENDGR